MTCELTPTQIRGIAREALAAIASTSPGHVFASRKGIVAAFNGRYNTAAFRRVNGTVRLEIWHNQRTTQINFHALPAYLQEKAAQMLDSL